jgi:predicted TIM-barrel fold metal-dependent hydrolase
MGSAARWFDDADFDLEVKRKVGRENADALFKLGLASLPSSALSGFAS